MWEHLFFANADMPIGSQLRIRLPNDYKSDMDFINDGEIIRPKYIIKCIKTKRWYWFAKREYFVYNRCQIVERFSSYEKAYKYLMFTGDYWRYIKTDESCL